MKSQIQNHALRAYYFLIALVVVIADQFTKWLISNNLGLHDSISIIPGLFRITHVQNQGAAFGLFADSPSEWKVAALIAFSVLALVVVSVLLWKNSSTISSTGIALSLILGGAVGNLWDRIVLGHVTDFLHFYIGRHQWPDFNIADSAIVIGALLLVSEIIFTKTAAEGSPATER